MGISLSGLTESSTGNLTLSAGSGNDVLIGNGSTQIYIDGGTDTLGIGGTALSGSRLNIETGAVALDFITSTGTAINVIADTVNDISGAATLAIVPTVQIGVMTYTSTNSMTYTDTASLYIAGIPVASTNVTFTNAAYALWVDAGAVRFDDRTFWIGGIAYEFPADNGNANEMLLTDGSGNLSWSSVASASAATTVTVTDNEAENESNLITFVAGAASTTGNYGLEMDGDFHYSPNTGTVTATNFSGNLTGTLQTAAQGTITSVGTLTDLTVSGTSTTIGTVTSGIWNAGAVTSSGAVTGASLVADLTTLDGNTLSTSSGNLAIRAYTGADVLIGDNDTILYVDGGAGTLGVGGAAVTGSRLNIETGAYNLDFITSTGTALNVVADTVNDTSGAATLAFVPTVQVGIQTYTATNAMVYTDTASLYIAGIPVASNSGDGTVTFTNTPYALWVAAGTSRFDGTITAATGSTIGNLTLANGSITDSGGALDFGNETLTTTGVITGGTVEATTDTAADDNSAMGYTSAEGLVLTGQGSTTDVTIKNDADATVLSIPTGTTSATFAGNITTVGTIVGTQSTTGTSEWRIRNTASSTDGKTRLRLTSAASDGDISVYFEGESGSINWNMGLVQSSDKFVISNNATLGSDDALRISNTSGDVELVEGDLTVTAGKVGIGIADPDQLLHIWAGSAGSVDANSNARLVIEDNATNAIQFLVPSGNYQSYIMFGDAADADIGFIEYNHLANTMAFRTNTATQMTIDSAGKVGIGIAAPATQLDIAKSAAEATSQIATYSTTDAHMSNLSFVKSGHATIGTLSATADDEGLGYISWNSVNNAGTPALAQSAYIAVYQDAGTSARPAARMDFATSDGTNIAPKLRIEKDGMLSMLSDRIQHSGSTAGTRLLHIENTNTTAGSNSQINLAVETIDSASSPAYGTGDPKITFGVEGIAGASYALGVDASTSNTVPNFVISSSFTLGTGDILTLTDAGTVLIGTTSAGIDSNTKLQLEVDALTTIKSPLFLRNDGTGSTLAGTGVGIQFQVGDANAGPSGVGSIWAYTTVESFDNVDQYVAIRAGNASPTTSNGQLIIKANGNVGIGATPNETLHVLTSGSSTYTAAAKRGLLITDANGPRIGWEDTGEGSNDKIMSVAYESENLVFGSMLDDGSNYDVNNILVLNRDGNVGIGTAPVAGFEAQLYVKTALVAADDVIVRAERGNVVGGGVVMTDNSSIQGIRIYDSIHKTSAAYTGGHTGVFCTVNIGGDNTQEFSGNQIGFYADMNAGHANNAAAGSVSGNMVGFQNQTSLAANGSSTASTGGNTPGDPGVIDFRGVGLLNGTAANRYGIYIDDTGGTVTNQYGLFMEDMNGATNDWAIYITGGQSYFGGNVGIGTSPSAYRLDVKAASDTLVIRALGSNGNVAAQIGATNTDEGYFDLLDGGSTKVRIAANMNTYFTGGNVGINETSPEEKLHITGGNIRLEKTDAGTSQLEFAIPTNSVRGRLHQASNEDLVLETITGNHDIRIDANTGNSNTMITMSSGSGKFGIGTNNPETTLTLAGKEGEPSVFNMWADEGDDNADKWRIKAHTDGKLTIGTFETGAWVENFIHLDNDIQIDSDPGIGIGVAPQQNYAVNIGAAGIYEGSGSTDGLKIANNGRGAFVNIPYGKIRTGDGGANQGIHALNIEAPAILWAVGDVEEASTLRIAGLPFEDGSSPSTQNWTASSPAGANVALEIDESTFTLADGNIPHVHAMRIRQQTVAGSGTVTNLSSLYIDNAPSISGASATNGPYAIYVAAGNSYFNGDISLAGKVSLTAGGQYIEVLEAPQNNGVTIKGNANPGLVIQEDSQEQWLLYGAGSGLYLKRDGTVQWSFFADGDMHSYGHIRMKNSKAIYDVGGSGNNWTANSLTHSQSVAGSQSLTLANTNGTNATSTTADLLVTVSASAGNLSGDPLIGMRVAGGLNWALGLDNSDSDIFCISSTTTVGGVHDAIHIDSNEIITFQNDQGNNFDYWCDGCGKTALTMFDCCGKVEWHDDTLALARMSSSDITRSEAGLQHMAKIGVMDIKDYPDGRWTGVNMQPAIRFTWDAVRQNRQRMDAQYEEHENRFSEKIRKLEALLKKMLGEKEYTLLMDQIE